VIAPGERGICRVRENRAGRLYSVVYGNPCAVHVDPIEKKPFYHFLPSANAFSIATAGCNLRCLYCQNWNISQVPPEETENVDLPPEEVVRYAQESAAPVIAYTYSEPIVFYEYVMACARLGREAGLYSAVISAGFVEPEPLRELCRAVDAIKIDLKGYDAGFYRKVCSAELAPVLRTIETVYETGVHLEIVNLVVPGLNDSLEQLRDLARWVAKELSPAVPLHFSRFMPQYKLTNLPPTPVETLDQAHQVAMEEGVRFVYVGNVPGHAANNTYCPACGKEIIVRQGFSVTEYHLRGGKCAYCEAAIPGVWWPAEPQAAPVEVRPGAPDQ
jgi:pyruvate formate lyase activating enzyme